LSLVELTDTIIPLKEKSALFDPLILISNKANAVPYLAVNNGKQIMTWVKDKIELSLEF